MGLPTSDRAYVFGIINIMKDATDRSDAKLRVVMVQEDILLRLQTELQRRRFAAKAFRDEGVVKSETRSAQVDATKTGTLTVSYEDWDPNDKANWFRIGIYQGLCEMATRYKVGTHGICGPMMRIEIAVPTGWIGKATVDGPACGGTVRPTH